MKALSTVSIERQGIVTSHHVELEQLALRRVDVVTYTVHGFVVVETVLRRSLAPSTPNLRVGVEHERVSKSRDRTFGCVAKVTVLEKALREAGRR